MKVRYELQRAAVDDLGYRWRIVEHVDGPVYNVIYRNVTMLTTAKRARRLLRELEFDGGGHQIGLVSCLECTELGAFRCVEPDTRAGFSTEVSWLCGDCAEKAGFCRGCGDFWAGCEQFEFSHIKGHCPNCVDQIESDMAEDGEFSDSANFDEEPV